jgi:hypothetical protein
LQVKSDLDKATGVLLVSRVPALFCFREGRSTIMRRKVKPYQFASSRAVAMPCMPLRWKFIVLSTAILLALAGTIALWLPEYRSIAWALVLFSSCHASFLLAQRIACEPTDPSTSTQDIAIRD